MREIFDKVGLATKKERVGVGKRRGMEKGAKKIGGKTFCFFPHERKGFFDFSINIEKVGRGLRYL